MSESGLQSPLLQSRWLSDSNALPHEAGVHLAERPFLSHINVRGNPQQPGFLPAFANCLGTDVATRCNTVVFAEKAAEPVVFCLGPDEWLVVADPGQEQPLQTALRKALDGFVAAVTDVGSGQTIIQVSGPQARVLLAKGCTLDLHPSMFGSGYCAQTLLAKAGVVLWPAGENCYELIVRRSFADYLWRWLTDAGRDLGLAIA